MIQYSADRPKSLSPCTEKVSKRNYETVIQLRIIIIYLSDNFIKLLFRYTALCPVTCGLCDPDESESAAVATPEPANDQCEDVGSNCADLMQWCTSEQTGEMMKVSFNLLNVVYYSS